MSCLYLKRWWELSCAGQLKEVQYIVKCYKCFGVGESLFIFGLVGNHQYFESDVGRYRKPVEGA